MSDSLIINSISFWYKNGRPLFEDFSLTLEPGALLLVQGENGSGKSTLLKILSTLFLPRKGTLRLGTWDFETHTQQVRPWIGYGCGPHQGFYPTLSGMQNLRFFHGLKTPSSEFPLDQAIDLANRLGLPEAALKQAVREYSNGMRQKLGLVRSFLGQPKLILLDEPFSCLDTSSEISLTRLLTDQRKDKTSTLVIASPKSDCARLLEDKPDHHITLGGG